MDMEVVMAPLGTEVREHGGDHGVLLGALEEGGGIGGIETVAPFLFGGGETVGLSGTADAAALTAHDLHQVIKTLTRLYVGDELLGVDQAIDHGDLDFGAVYIVGDLPNGLIAPNAGNTHLTQGVFGLIRQAVAHHRLRHAAGDAIDHRRTGAQAEGKVRGLQLQLV